MSNLTESALLVTVCVSPSVHHVITVDKHTTVGMALHQLYGNVGVSIEKSAVRMCAVQRDGMGKVIGTRMLVNDDLLIPYARNGNVMHHRVHDVVGAQNKVNTKYAAAILQPVSSLRSNIIINVSSCSTPTSIVEDEEMIYDGTANVDLWVVAQSVSIYFNAYVRMVLGLPLWHLEVPINGNTTVGKLEDFIRKCLRLDSTDERFALHGYYEQEQCVVSLSNDELVVSLSKANEPAFWQFMMRRDQEDTINLGISRQSPLWVKEKGKWEKGKNYWCTLQGTSFYMFPKRFEREGLKRIDNLYMCQIRKIHRLNPDYEMQIKTINGKVYKLKSPSKRRIEKWYKAIDGCLQYGSGINDPITIEEIMRLTAPRDHPDCIPLYGTSNSNGGCGQNNKSASLSLPKSRIETMQRSQEQPYTTYSFQHATVPEKIYRTLELFKDPATMELWKDKSNSHRCAEQVRLFLLEIVQITESYPTLFVKMMPQLKAIIKITSQFLELVETDQFDKKHNEKYVKSMLENTDCILNIYKGHEFNEDDNSTVLNHRNREYLRKLELYLQFPIIFDASSDTTIHLNKEQVVNEIKETIGAKEGIFDWLCVGNTKKHAKISEEELRDLSKDIDSQQQFSKHTFRTVVEKESHPANVEPAERGLNIHSKQSSVSSTGAGLGKILNDLSQWKNNYECTSIVPSECSIIADDEAEQSQSCTRLRRFNRKACSSSAPSPYVEEAENEQIRTIGILESSDAEVTETAVATCQKSTESCSATKVFSYNASPHRITDPLATLPPRIVIDETKPTHSPLGRIESELNSECSSVIENDIPVIIQYVASPVPTQRSGTMPHRRAMSLRSNGSRLHKPYVDGLSLDDSGAEMIKSMTGNPGICLESPVHIEDLSIDSPRPRTRCPDASLIRQQRRMSMVEIDDIVLRALLKDPTIAKMIRVPSSPKMASKGRDSRAMFSMSQSPISSTYGTVCAICNIKVRSESVWQNAYISVHPQCLRCGDCGRQLCLNSFRLDGRIARCREPCSEMMSRSKSEGVQPIKPKSILKKTTSLVS